MPADVRRAAIEPLCRSMIDFTIHRPSPSPPGSGSSPTQREKRSKIEVIADEIGPSLRWATAEVKKNDRRSPGGDGGGGGGGRPVANEPSGGGGYDEEPF